MNKHEIITRAVIFHNGKLLGCRSTRQKSHYFLPGGHVEFTENIEKALVREIKEELAAKVIATTFMGVIENIWHDGKKDRHELNILFEVRLKNYRVSSREEKLTFDWIPLKKLSQTKIMPLIVIKFIQRWLKTKKIFFAPQVD